MGWAVGMKKAFSFLGKRSLARSDTARSGRKQLVGLLRQMIARPDFIRLSITLPGHPELAPPWLKAWVAQTQSLAADSKARFAQVPNVPDCAQTFA